MRRDALVVGMLWEGGYGCNRGVDLIHVSATAPDTWCNANAPADLNQNQVWRALEHTTKDKPVPVALGGLHGLPYSQLILLWLVILVRNLVAHLSGDKIGV